MHFRHFMALCCIYWVGFAAAGQAQKYVSRRPPIAQRKFVSAALEQEIKRVQATIADPKLRWMFVNCYPNTLDTTVEFEERDGKPYTFVLTGDIHAMWLRDSGAQLFPYLPLTKRDVKLRRLIAGVINMQSLLLTRDPYANAFNKRLTDPTPWKSDGTVMKPGVHERKWELDSPCYAIRLAYHYWKTTGDVSVFDDRWLEAMHAVYRTMREQQHKTDSVYYTFTRVTDRQGDTQLYQGKGSPVSACGLIASAFRPSDDATIFGFLIPSNMFAVVSLKQLAEILRKVRKDNTFAQDCQRLAEEVNQAIERCAVITHPKAGRIYAFEVDGFGNALAMDDANVPSLLGIPYLGYVDAGDTLYQNTRRFVWSHDNPYFYKGKAGEGISGPHIGYRHIWPMSIIVKALTSSDVNEIRGCLKMLVETDNDTGFIHESFHKDDASIYTREWMAWANTLFGELILKIEHEHPQLLREMYGQQKAVRRSAHPSHDNL